MKKLVVWSLLAIASTSYGIERVDYVNVELTKFERGRLYPGTDVFVDVQVCGNSIEHEQESRIYGTYFSLAEDNCRMLHEFETVELESDGINDLEDMDVRIDFNDIERAIIYLDEDTEGYHIRLTMREDGYLSNPYIFSTRVTLADIRKKREISGTARDGRWEHYYAELLARGRYDGRGEPWPISNSEARMTGSITAE